MPTRTARPLRTFTAQALTRYRREIMAAINTCDGEKVAISVRTAFALHDIVAQYARIEANHQEPKE